MAEETPQQPKSSGSGCLKAAGIGCLVVIVLVVVAGWLVYSNIGKITSKVMVVAAEQAFTAMNMPEGEKQAAMVPIRELADKIAAGEITKEQAMSVLNSLAEGPLPIAITMRAFQVKYVDASSLPAEEKKEAAVSISRFARGLMDEKIDRSKGEEVAGIVTVKTTGANGQETSQLKEAITSDELKQCLQIMKDAADKAGIENKMFPVDLAAEIRKAIQKGMAAGAKKQ